MRRLVICVLPLAFFAACNGDVTNAPSDPDAASFRPPAGGKATTTPRDPGAGDGGGALPEATAPNPDGGAPIGRTPYVDFQVNHVLITGQSNAVALSGTPVLSRTQVRKNLMFDTGVMSASGCDGSGCRTYQPPTSFRPLVEGDKFFSWPVETISSGMANEITRLAAGKTGPQPDHQVLASVHGRSGTTYWCLRKGGCNYHPGYLSPFAQGLMEVSSAKAIAAAINQSYVVRAVAAIHGESDHYSYTFGSQEFPLDGSDGTPGKLATYADAMLEWQADYESSVRAITGQSLAVPLFISQISGWNDTTYSKVAQFQLEAHARAPGKVVLIGPTYMLDVDERDCRHFMGVGEQQLGEYFAKVYARVVFDGLPWEPLRPKTVTRDGASLKVDFLVPAPPLAIDTTLVNEAQSYGFTYVDAAGVEVPISGVALDGPTGVKITFTGPPPAGGHLRYAQNQVAQTCIGPQVGARGNLRDSDATPSENGYALYNWAVHFDVAVP